MPKASQAKKTGSSRAKPGDGQTALSIVERLIGGKLIEQEVKKRPYTAKKTAKARGR
jgi:hypothetical protein